MVDSLSVRDFFDCSATHKISLQSNFDRQRDQNITLIIREVGGQPFVIQKEIKSFHNGAVLKPE